MTARGKKFKEASKLIEGRKLYEPKAAIAIAKKASYAKFDGLYQYA
jgi:ribosomal protein L1